MFFTLFVSPGPSSWCIFICKTQAFIFVCPFCRKVDLYSAGCNFLHSNLNNISWYSGIWDYSIHIIFDVACILKCCKEMLWSQKGLIVSLDVITHLIIFTRGCLWSQIFCCGDLWWKTVYIWQWRLWQVRGWQFTK